MYVLCSSHAVSWLFYNSICGHFTQGQCITTEGPISEKCLAEGRVFIFSLDLHRLRYVRGGSIAKDTVVYE